MTAPKKSASLLTAIALSFVSLASAEPANDQSGIIDDIDFAKNSPAGLFPSRNAKVDEPAKRAGVFPSRNLKDRVNQKKKAPKKDGKKLYPSRS